MSAVSEWMLRTILGVDAVFVVVVVCRCCNFLLPVDMLYLPAENMLKDFLLCFNVRSTYGKSNYFAFQSTEDI
jgi:hypothetical protein